MRYRWMYLRHGGFVFVEVELELGCYRMVDMWFRTTTRVTVEEIAHLSLNTRLTFMVMPPLLRS
jgi:hypothetical protein